MPEPVPVSGRKSPVSGTVLEPLLGRVHIDFVPADPQPSWIRWALASVVAVVGSLAVDAALVAVGEAVFPGTKHFVHFQFSDYGKLTVVGVVVACVGWPVVTRCRPVPAGSSCVRPWPSRSCSWCPTSTSGTSASRPGA